MLRVAGIIIFPVLFGSKSLSHDFEGVLPATRNLLLMGKCDYEIWEGSEAEIKFKLEKTGNQRQPIDPVLILSPHFSFSNFIFKLKAFSNRKPDFFHHLQY